MFKQPFIYQTECLTTLAGARANNTRNGLAVMASGLGKTVMSALDARAHLEKKDGKLLYLCHQNIILDQACNTFKEILGDGRKYGFFNGWERSIHQADTVFASLQTIRKHYRSFKPDEFRHVIVDEGHHSQALTYYDPINYFCPAWKLGLTATPIRHDGRSILSIFGSPLYNLPLEDAIVRNLLTPVLYKPLTEELAIQGVDLNSLNLSLDDIDNKIFARRRDDEIAAIIAKHAKEISDPRTIIFANSIQRANELLRCIPGSVAYHSKIPSKDRAVRLELFRLGMLQTIITVDCFNEGVDIPEANLIVFLRSTASRTIFFQQLGRGLRRFEGKKFVTVLDFVANCERITEIKDFADLIEARRKALHLEGNTSSFHVAFDETALKVVDFIRRVSPVKIKDVPELLAEYSERNQHPPSYFVSTSFKEVWWKCKVCSYEYQANPRLMLAGKRCPKCDEQLTETNNLASAYPEMAKEYSLQNDIPAERVRVLSSQVALWSCAECGYAYKASVKGRTQRGDRCPKCSAEITYYKSNMAFILPHLQDEYADVNILSPNRIHSKSNKRVWWKCKRCGQNYQASVLMQSIGSGTCHGCKDKKWVSVADIMTQYPHLAEEFSSRNRKPVDSMFSDAHEQFWWICSSCGRYWQASRTERLNGKGCPHCPRFVPVSAE